jgi:hypothetical protein
MDLCDMNLEQFMIGENQFRTLRDTVNTSFRMLLGCADSTRYGFASTFPYGVRILQQITKGLKHLHDLGLTHRDLKPANSKP